jgi:2-oxoisovalerate ferredoxin oxidoreductase beta subunit
MSKGSVIKHTKPHSFYKTFERKGPGQVVTHYCPGCGHGTAHKLIAELLDELNLQDRTIMLSPVGCSVFLYYYFDTANIQCSHGRSPAVATGLRRSLDEAIIICYQGDGDLAGIGTTEIIHAANRGENLTVFFINNAVYGMTGGQMAPTTLLGQKTLTTPEGRDLQNDGQPLGMAEIIDALKSPVFIERISLATPAKVLQARRVFKKALENQVEKRGFSFVEVLSPCPINWKMEPQQARQWLAEQMEPVFPVKNFRDKTSQPTETQPEINLKFDAKPAPTRHPGFPRKHGFPGFPGNHGNHGFQSSHWLDDQALLKLLKGEKANISFPESQQAEDEYIKIAGFGGQGVMSAGILLANCAIALGLQTSWLPSYGPEMRGGTANSSVIISRHPIGSLVVDAPNRLIVMNMPSLDLFENQLQAGGSLYINSSLINRKVQRTDIKPYYIPASDMAKKAGLVPAANIIMLCFYVLSTGIFDLEVIEKIIPLSIKEKQYLDLNLAIIKETKTYYEQNKTHF